MRPNWIFWIAYIAAFFLVTVIAGRLFGADAGILGTTALFALLAVAWQVIVRR